jgi:hypothetical protein
MRLTLCVLMLIASPTVAVAQPQRIIILRHAEKANSYALCGLGERRAQALAKEYLGKGAANSLFGPGEAPAAILAITLHSLETVTPAAQSWALPVIDYAVVPEKDQGDDAKESLIDQRTKEAAHDVMTDPRYDGKIVVMVWEHKHIASKKLEKASDDGPVTLRELLRIDHLEAPKKWSDSNYDYFWIVDYAKGEKRATGFKMVKEAFSGAYADLPSNDWDAPEPVHEAQGCLR